MQLPVWPSSCLRSVVRGRRRCRQAQYLHVFSAAPADVMGREELLLACIRIPHVSSCPFRSGASGETVISIADFG